MQSIKFKRGQDEGEIKGPFCKGQVHAFSEEGWLDDAFLVRSAPIRTVIITHAANISAHSSLTLGFVGEANIKPKYNTSSIETRCSPQDIKN